MIAMDDGHSQYRRYCMYLFVAIRSVLQNFCGYQHSRNERNTYIDYSCLNEYYAIEKFISLTAKLLIFVDAYKDIE